MADADVSDLRKLEQHLGKIPVKLLDEVGKSTHKAALNVRWEWRNRWLSYKAPYLSDAITYDLTYGWNKIKVEIGPDKNKRQGALGNLFEFGSEHNDPIPGGQPALDKEEPKFTAALEKILGRVLDE